MAGRKTITLKIKPLSSQSAPSRSVIDSGSEDTSSDGHVEASDTELGRDQGQDDDDDDDDDDGDDEEMDDDDDDDDEDDDENEEEESGEEADVSEAEELIEDDEDEDVLEASLSSDSFDNNEFDAEVVAPARMTARQLSQAAGPLTVEPPVSMTSRSNRKKALSAEEQRIMRAELARRRKNLSDQRLEEEKQDTLDKLLRKRAGRSRKDESEEHLSTPKSRLLEPTMAFLTYVSGPRYAKYCYTPR